MSKTALDLKRMNEIIEKTIVTIDSGRQEIFEIAEDARKDCERFKKELTSIQQKISLAIFEVDGLEREERRTKAKLMMVSKDFNRYSEEDIRLAYEEANNVRVKHILKKQEEKELICRRTELELNLKRTYEIVQKAEKLVSQVGVAMDFLKGNLSDIFETIEDMHKKQLLGIKIIEAQEEERMRVSREIHDGPAQSMANVVLKAELCERLLAIDINQSRLELRKLKDIVRGSLKDIRKIIYDLRPMSLDDLGLVPTIKRYTDNFTDETGINVELMVINEQQSINSIIEIACFRIIQEALNNISKHSRARDVLIKIEQTMDKISIVIKDNGIGFEMNNLKRNPEKNGFGLIGMKERAELLNGKLDIISAFGEGTKIILTIPLERKDELYE
ncbi:sensor histidine kinase [Proteiniborus sp. MB09-C3]|uniref:sensor histidine kinase n=1 Tax=Proteiniborus sp. MB09-C3 TaxID=3050072 RepID=UPI002553EC28|nr:sensor histidine kinase [Proteiniborus sp. MB09-C3]WIV10508.1 sensor histidine kinase [Proteiniborus sp. MB09-C3]